MQAPHRQVHLYPSEPCLAAQSTAPTKDANATTSAVNTDAAAEGSARNEQEFSFSFAGFTLSGWINNVTFDVFAKLQYTIPTIQTSITIADNIKGNLRDGLDYKFDVEGVQGELKLFLKNGREVWMSVKVGNLGNQEFKIIDI